MYPIVVRISIWILHDDGVADQIVACSVESEEEQREADREEKRQDEVLHHRSAQRQRQAQIGAGTHQDHVRLVRTFHGGYTSAMDHPQTHYVFARGGASDETVHPVLKPEGLEGKINNQYNYRLG